MTVHIEYDQVDWLAGQLTAAIGTLDDGHNALNDTEIGRAAFGDGDDAATCAWKYRLQMGAAVDAMAEMIGALEADRSKMRRMVQTFRATDQETADRIWAEAGTSMDVYSAHVHSHDGGLSRAEDQAIRADQIGRLGDVTGEYEGASVVAADLNTEAGRDTPSSEAVGDLERDGNYTSIYHDGPGEGEREIDHVLGSPNVVATDSNLVETDGLSDHDGQQVEIEVQRW